jgi:predicted DNA-binding transcriptional regulator YafY
MTEERFDPPEIEGEAFEHSLGVHQGSPEEIRVAFDEQIARYVKGRLWHGSQVLSDEPDGSVIVTLQVSIDRALQAWILGFGSLARVLSPPSLAAQIAEELERARARYDR